MRTLHLPLRCIYHDVRAELAVDSVVRHGVQILATLHMTLLSLRVEQTLRQSALFLVQRVNAAYTMSVAMGGKTSDSAKDLLHY
jgi:hypothetical protein